MKLYLAGPMRGLPMHNFPAFDLAAAQLRALGHEVFSPAEHDREIGYDPAVLPTRQQLQQMMRWDLERVMESEGVAFLPGWEQSRGASMERAVAHFLGLPCYDFGDTLVLQLPYQEPFIVWQLDTPPYPDPVPGGFPYPSV